LPSGSAGPPVPIPGGLPSASQSNIDTTLSDSWLIIRKRKWIILSAALLGAIIGVMSALSTPKVYEAVATIQVHPGSSDQYKVASSASSGVGGDDIGVRLETEVSILESNSLILDVVKDLKLQDNMDFWGVKRPIIGHTDVDSNPELKLRVIDTFKRSLTVKRIPKTEILSIAYTSVSPTLSSEIVNTLVAKYVDRTINVHVASSDYVTNRLRKKLDALKNEVQDNEEKVVALQKQLGLVGLDDKKNLVADQLEFLTKAMTDARLSRIVTETKYRVLEDTNPDLYEGGTSGLSYAEPAFVGGAGLLSTERAQLATLETQKAQETAIYGPKWPDVIQLDAQIVKLQSSIKTEEARILEQSKGTYLAAKANEDMAIAAFNDKEAEAYKSQDALVQYAIELRRFQSSRELYEGLISKLQEAGIEAGLQSSEIDVVDIALIPVSPTGPRRPAIVFMGMIFGVMGGVAMAFLMESLDTSLRSIAEIEAVMELPSLAVIPRARRNLATKPGEMTPAYMRNIDVLSQPKSQFSEAFRSLRTSLLLSTVGRPPQIILVTSSIPSEGKTTIATNVAAALSQRDVRVLLIDADLRRPTVHHRFGLSAKTGLTTVLANTTRLEDTLQTLPELPNLDILASGPVPPFPTEMIGSERMAQILHDARDKYEHIVIDSPPILSVTDGVILARQSDAVALVMRHGGVSKHIVRRSRDLLLRAGAPLTGIILNAVDLSSPDYYGYYGYYRYSYVSAGEPGLGGRDEELGRGPQKTEL